ncbi:class F sortase [Nocardioides alpinus]|uniref:Class F sortase n=1 Tax=Nocardioides alpinus TaxID=748909 RepID=A0ABX4QU95_9ACTN|nr:class F sortase [Nocardioides alpinus]
MGRATARLLVLGAATASVVGVLVLAVAVARGGASTAGSGEGAVAEPAPAVQAERGTSMAASAPRTGALTPEPPQRAVLPSGTAVPVVAVSTTDDGTLDVPSDVDVAGWWRGGSRIGDPFGSVLLSAHVDSAADGLGPYVELLDVRRGQSVVLTSESLRQEYVVSSLRLLDKGPLAEHAWVYAATGPHRLVLVTCAGPFDAGRGGYQRLAVVTATPVGEPTRRSP